jgi:hypothetical protein
MTMESYLKPKGATSMTAKTTHFSVFVHEAQTAHRPDGTINYKMLNGFVYDENNNQVGIVHLNVKADVEFPAGGESLTLTFSDNSKLEQALKPVQLKPA